MSNLAIIPARGGSKRIPRKNIKSFLGKPIIAYSIEAAIKSNIFDEIMVSTDDDEIAEIAKSYDAKVPFVRSSQNSNDYATTFDVIKEVVNNYQQLGKRYDKICCIYPCAPLISKESIEYAYKKLINTQYDSVFPVVQFSYPIQRSLKIDVTNKLKFIYSEYNLTRTQDLEKAYHDAGQFYWMKIETCLEKGQILTDNTGPIVISEIESQDIDNETDWKLAELKYKLLINDLYLKKA